MVPHQYAIDCPSFLCAPDDRVGLDGIAGLFQEAAWQHAGKLGVAFTEAESEVFWALHRLGVRVHRRPLWGEPVTVTTWPSRIQRLYAMREYEIRSKPAGELLVEGSSAWIVLRTRDSRPVPPARYFPEGDLDGAYSIEITAGKPPLIADTDAVDLLRHARWHQVRPSDTDRNAHVNNTRYAQWFLDEAPGVLQPLMEERSQATLLLSFTAEARIGQEFAIIANAPGETLAGIAEIRVRDPGQPVEEARCACRLQWLEPGGG